ncbi:MAG TPA: molecular chaperone HtpG [Phycisphaerales bacterium]|nr:molecular chaperone HtpG [Phycisphaerales bacterium]
MSQTETMEFQAEAKQLLELMIHSVYSEKDVFLRELISNASDALDKLRLEALLDKEAKVDTSDLHIFLETDKEKRTLTIHDNGVGMNRDEVVRLIGTIAKSGTKEFLKNLEQSKDKKDSEQLIGQFGVGFYSAFMVADKVELLTRRLGEEKAVQWSSAGDGTYTITDAEKDSVGTTITLHLKEVDEEDGLHDYTDSFQVKQLIKRYSDFISYPIKMEMEVTKYVEDKPVKEKEIQTLNSQKALWVRPQEEVDQEEYNGFYRHIAHDWNAPWKTVAFKAEGTFEYYSLLFLPERAPMDLFHPEGHHGLQLYVKRVFIMDDCKELIPSYLRFVRGVVDASDLSLNVSREILQKDRQIKQISKRLVRKVLDTLKDTLTESREDYKKFWLEFGRVVKEGIYHDMKMRDKILGLSLFKTTQTGKDELVTLDEYIERMQEGQDKIYYLTGDARESLVDSPHLEAFKKEGIEVLLLTDSVDEVWISAVGEYSEKSFVSAAESGLEIGSEESRKAAEEEKKKTEKEMATFISWLQSKLDDKIKEVKVSTRLVDSPACLVSPPGEMTANMERLMRAMGQEVPVSKKILEINTQHPLVAHLAKRYEADKDSEELGKTAAMLYQLSVLAEGSELDDPAGFARNVASVLGDSLAK